MQVKVVRAHRLEEMKLAVARGGLDFYRSTGAWKFSADDLLGAPLDVPDAVPSLGFSGKPSERSTADAEHAILIHGFVGDLQEAQARDARLWAWLCHAVFPDYCRNRWPLPKKDEEARSSVLSHWFLDGRRGPATALRRNAVARLWWAAHLTKAPWTHDQEFAFLKQDDEYAFTRVLLANQDMFQQTLERQFGSSRRILLAVLEVVRRDMLNRSNSAFITQLAKRVNLNSRFRELSAVPAPDLVEMFLKLTQGR